MSPPDNPHDASAADPAGTSLAALTPRLRIDFGAGIRLGPGKIELLEAIAASGSISGAGRVIGMSYRRAWLLVEEMNALFREPLVVAHPGGVQGGGARVTPLGEAVVATFHRIEARTKDVIAEEFAPMTASLAPPQAHQRATRTS